LAQTNANSISVCDAQFAIKSDILCARISYTQHTLIDSAACRTKFSVEHTFSCPKGGFPSIHHNKIQDIAASLLTEVCHEVEIEPTLQPVTGEHFILASSNTDDDG